MLIFLFQNHLDSSTVAKIMKDLPSAKEASLIKTILNIPSFIVSKIPDAFVNRTLKLKMPKTAIAHLMDLTKDSLFLFELVLSQGGFFYIMAQSLPYIRGVSYFSIIFAVKLKLISSRFSFVCLDRSFFP